MTAPLTGTEFAAMESLLGRLVDHCDQRQQRELLRFHERLSEIRSGQASDHARLEALRLLAQPRLVDPKRSTQEPNQQKDENSEYR